MSSLIVASDLDLMMLEVSIEQLVVPRETYFDSAILKKTVAMFRLLDKDWTSIYPQRKDYHVYRGTNSEMEAFNGGVSVVFPLPQSSLEKNMEKIDLQLHVHRELSKYFELQSSQSIGIACIDVSDLFNGVIESLKKRNDSALSTSREPVAKSSKNTYELLKEDGKESGAKAIVYLRLSHLGHSVISEIDVPDDPKRLFYGREETSEKLPYQFREITTEELTSGCWGSDTLLPPKDPRDTMCCCDSKDLTKLPQNLGNSPDSNDSGKHGSDDDDKNAKNGKKGGKKPSKNGKGKGKKGKNGKGDGENDGDGNGNDDHDKKSENGEENDEKKLEEEDDGEGTASCLVKPFLCGRDGTCRKKDKKGKFGKCGKPDGEGGNPMACGERRKCARRRMASGGATVGIVDKKPPCIPTRPQTICPCPPARNCNPLSSWSSSYATSTPCATCQPLYYNADSSPYSQGTQNSFCNGYQNRGYLQENNNNNDNAAATGCRDAHLAGWR